MSVAYFMKLYLLTVPVFFVIDIVWLGVIARGFYRRHLDFILSDDVNWVAAVTFYLIYIAGIIFFAVRPSLASDRLSEAALLGGLFGFFTYATYDLTNMATIRSWPLKIVVIDILWGTCLCALVAGLSFLIARHLL